MHQALNPRGSDFTKEDGMTHKHQQKPHDNKTAAAMPDQEQLREEIQQLAYTFYCQCGNEHGHDLEHWVEAERHVLERYQGKTTTRG